MTLVMAAAVGKEPPVAVNLATHDPRPRRPAGEPDAVPGTPATFSDLPFIADVVGALQIDKDEVGVVAHGDAALADDVPHAGRRVAHPVDHLFQRAAPTVDFVEHQRQ